MIKQGRPKLFSVKDAFQRLISPIKKQASNVPETRNTTTMVTRQISVNSAEYTAEKPADTASSSLSTVDVFRVSSGSLPSGDFRQPDLECGSLTVRRLEEAPPSELQSTSIPAEPMQSSKGLLMSPTPPVRKIILG